MLVGVEDMEFEDGRCVVVDQAGQGFGLPIGVELGDVNLGGAELGPEEVGVENGNAIRMIDRVALDDFLNKGSWWREIGWGIPERMRWQ